MPTQSKLILAWEKGMNVWMDYNNANMAVSLIHAENIVGASRIVVEVHAASDYSLIGSGELSAASPTFAPPGTSVQIDADGKWRLTGGRVHCICHEAG